MQSAAAGLRRGHGHFASVILKNSHGGFIQPGERNVRNASREKRHAVALLSLGWKRLSDLREEEGRFRWGRQTLQASQFSEQAQHAGGPQDSLHAARLIQV